MLPFPTNQRGDSIKTRNLWRVRKFQLYEEEKSQYGVGACFAWGGGGGYYTLLKFLCKRWKI